MNAIEMLKNDHQKVRELFREITAANKKPQPLVEQVLQELETHATLEEEIFYPALRAKAGEENDARLKGLLDEAIKEHNKVKKIIGKVKSLDREDEQFETEVEELMDSVTHHVEEEEDEMLPLAEEKLADDLDRLASEMQNRKRQLLPARQ